MSRLPLAVLDQDAIAERLDGERAASDFLIGLRSALTTGDELHATLCACVGYGLQDHRLLGFLSRVQKDIEGRAR